MKFSDFRQDLLEGVYDPGIFKAFFLAGGAGSGKSYSAEKATGSAAGKFQWHEKIEDKNITLNKSYNISSESKSVKYDKFILI